MTGLKRSNVGRCTPEPKTIPQPRRAKPFWDYSEDSPDRVGPNNADNVVDCFSLTSHGVGYRSATLRGLRWLAFRTESKAVSLLG